MRELVCASCMMRCGGCYKLREGHPAGRGGSMCSMQAYTRHKAPLLAHVSRTHPGYMVPAFMLQRHKAAAAGVQHMSMATRSIIDSSASSSPLVVLLAWVRQQQQG